MNDTSAAAKSPTAFRTISEASDELGVPQHVLRFWEDKFSQLRPMKRAGGRRYYRPEDMALLKRIQGLLHVEGYTIKGVQKLMKDQGKAEFMGSGAPVASRVPASMATADARTAQMSAQNAATVPVSAPPAVSGISGQDRQVLEATLADLKTLRAKLPV